VDSRFRGNDNMQKPYNKNKIGKFIGWGGEHLVFQYGDKQVIKFSLHVFISGKSAVDKIIKDYNIGNRYFNRYLLPTEILHYKKGKRCVEIQEKIECRFLEKKDLQIDLIKQQFNDIMKRYERIKKETGEVFDLFGREGLFRLKSDVISNILVTSSPSHKGGVNNKLILIDFTILKLDKIKIREIPIWLFIEWAKRRQKKLLKKFIK